MSTARMRRLVLFIARRLRRGQIELIEDSAEVVDRRERESKVRDRQVMGACLSGLLGILGIHPRRKRQSGDALIDREALKEIEIDNRRENTGRYWLVVGHGSSLRFVEATVIVAPHQSNVLSLCGRGMGL
jgi:hypothetical protein